MNFSESEGTGLQFSESEGTGISVSESDGTGIIFSESEGTGIMNKGPFKIVLMLLVFFSQFSHADTSFLYEVDKNVYQGILIKDDGITQMIEGYIENNILYGILTKSVDDGTGKSVDDGTGKSVDDGTGKSVDDGTGKSVDDGTGKSVDDGTGKLITISMNCNLKTELVTTIESHKYVDTRPLNKLFINGNEFTCN